MTCVCLEKFCYVNRITLKQILFSIVLLMYMVYFCKKLNFFYKVSSSKHCCQTVVCFVHLADCMRYFHLQNDAPLAPSAYSGCVHGFRCFEVLFAGIAWALDDFQSVWRMDTSCKVSLKCLEFEKFKAVMKYYGTFVSPCTLRNHGTLTYYAWGYPCSTCIQSEHAQYC